MRRRARDLRPASGANASPGLPVGRSILAFLFDLDETSSRGVIEALTADASLEGTWLGVHNLPISLANASPLSLLSIGSLQPTLPVGAFVDFLNRLKRQASHESTQQLLGHIRRFNALDVASLDEGGPDSAPAVFRRLVAFHSVSRPFLWLSLHDISFALNYPNSTPQHHARARFVVRLPGKPQKCKLLLHSKLASNPFPRLRPSLCFRCA